MASVRILADDGLGMVALGDDEVASLSVAVEVVEGDLLDGNRRNACPTHDELKQILRDSVSTLSLSPREKGPLEEVAAPGLSRFGRNRSTVVS